MPTGYTAELMEKGLPFRTFVLQCARAFGACVMQRDEGMESLPRKQTPSDYYAKAVKKAKAELKRLEAMSPAKQEEYGDELRADARSRALQMLAKEREENRRLEAMATQVRAWEPPTDEHKGLKDFMLEQIKISRHDEAWAEKYVREAEEKTPMAYYIEALSKAMRDVPYYEEEQRKEEGRTDDRNEWIDRLYRSLPRK